jgi:hypothetical protein
MLYRRKELKSFALVVGKVGGGEFIQAFPKSKTAQFFFIEFPDHVWQRGYSGRFQKDRRPGLRSFSSEDFQSAYGRL